MKKCKKCGNKIERNVNFCTKCGKKIKRHGFVKFILLLVIIFLIFLLINKYTNILKKGDSVIINNEEIKYTNSYEHIKYDYEQKIISANEYLKQMYALEFDSKSLSKKYKNDNNNYFLTSDQLNIIDFIEKNYKKLDKNLVEKYARKKLLQDVQLKSNSISKSSSSIIKLSKEDPENVSSHVLNKARLSSNGRFLLWYTDTGNDAITENEVNVILNELDNSVNDLEQLSKIKYSYEPYIDNKNLVGDYLSATIILQECNIPVDSIKTAMSIYVYDTGSDVTLAQYTDTNLLNKYLNYTGLSSIRYDGVINYPYVFMNKKGLNEIDSLKQVSRHELFHHFQTSYCKANDLISCDDTKDGFMESYANYASAITGNYQSTENFLNNWMGAYYRDTSLNIDDVKGGSPGYAIFPYLYSYSLMVDNSSNIFNKALLENEPLKYINKNTSREKLKSTINDLAVKLLSKNYKNNAFVPPSDDKLDIKGDISKNDTYKYEINKGAIDYFEINKFSDVEITSDDYSYITFMLIGVKNNEYSIISKVSTKLKQNIYDFGYDKVYLAVTNGNLDKKYNYQIKVTESKATNKNYNTTYNNYNIEIISKISMKGASVITTSKGVVDEIHQKEYLEITTNTLGVAAITNKTYIDFNSGYSYTSVPFQENMWYKDKNSQTKFDLGLILQKLKSSDNVEKIDDNHFKVKLSKSELQSSMKSTSSKKMTIVKGMNIDVYTTGNDISTIKYDFSKIIPGVDEFSSTVNFTNYNAAGNVEIPNEIIETATDK
ncbi:MAG: zinc ribbon domain-containing protein [Bacilli bacterium]|nr:zinc ribbon domain-containing protein [Bacilli bacterium]